MREVKVLEPKDHVGTPRYNPKVRESKKKKTTHRAIAPKERQNEI